jgi:hypothetical protein
MTARFQSFINPAAQDEAEYASRHGMSRAQHAERQTAWLRERFEENATEDLNGEPPPDICGVKGLPPQRGRWARFQAWQRQVADELCELNARRTEIQAKLANAETEIKIGARRAADQLLAGVDGGDDAKVMAAMRLAGAARIALPELDEKIDVAKTRVKRLDDRASEFLNAALVEVAKGAGLGQLYLKKIAELREVAELLWGLSKVIGIGRLPQSYVEFPRAILTNGEHRDYIIDAEARESVWIDIMRSLQSDPRRDIGVHVSGC